MTLDGNTNVAKLLDAHPELLSIFVGISPHFKKLENRFLRKTVARRVTLSQAAKVGGVELDHLLEALNVAVNGGSDAGGQSVPDADVDWTDPEEAEPDQYRLDFEYDDPQIAKTLDVREDISSNRDPLARIMRAAKEIDPGRILVVINSFEPVPLYEVLGKKGFVHRTEKEGANFRILFKRVKNDKEKGDAEPASFSGRTPAAGGDEKVVEMDVRGLEPPEPMMRILKALNTLEDNAILLVHHHREPVLLYDRLEERAFEAIANRIGENHYKIVIRRKSAG